MGFNSGFKGLKEYQAHIPFDIPAKIRQLYVVGVPINFRQGEADLYPTGINFL